MDEGTIWGPDGVGFLKETAWYNYLWKECIDLCCLPLLLFMKIGEGSTEWSRFIDTSLCCTLFLDRIFSGIFPKLDNFDAKKEFVSHLAGDD